MQPREQKKQDLLLKIAKNSSSVSGAKISFSFRDQAITCFKSLRSNTFLASAGFSGGGLDDKSGFSYCLALISQLTFLLASYLAACLAINNSITYLDLSKSCIGPEGMKLSSSKCSLIMVKKFVGFIQVAKGIKENRSLKGLRISTPQSSAPIDAGIESLLDACAERKAKKLCSG